jgi:hypothetical protein
MQRRLGHQYLTILRQIHDVHLPMTIWAQRDGVPNTV